MIVKRENKVLSFIKKFWIYIIAGILVIGVGVTLGVVAATRDAQNVIDVSKPDEDENNSPEDGENNGAGNLGGGENNEDQPQNPDENKPDKEEDQKPVVNPEVLVFGLPMSNAVIIKDYTDTKLEYNPTLDRWEAHMYIDFTADDPSVMSVLDGKVLSIEYDYLTGYVVTIEHSDGFISTYASLSDDVKVKVGDSVTKGQVIGVASSLAASSSGYGDHLEFTLLKDNKKIDPNNYLDLQEK